MLSNEQRKRLLLSVTVIFLCSAMLPVLVHAMSSTKTETRYTNANILNLPHETPASFTVLPDGGFTGVTDGGRTFRQIPVLPDSGVRLNRFSIDAAYWYVSDRGIIWAQGDLHALSIYQTLVV